MKANDSTEWPTFQWCFAAWSVIAVATWGIVVLLALTFIADLLARSLVPAPILLALAVLPVCLSTIPIMVMLYFASKRLFPKSLKSCQMFVIIGTPPLTLLALWLSSLLVGGVDFFIPRL